MIIRIGDIIMAAVTIHGGSAPGTIHDVACGQVVNVSASNQIWTNEGWSFKEGWQDRKHYPTATVVTAPATFLDALHDFL